MEWIKLFKLYNRRVIKQHGILYLFVMLSIIISVSISLAIPQILVKTDEFLNHQLAEMNGADLKVSADFSSPEFENRINALKAQGTKVNEHVVRLSRISHGSSKVSTDVVLGQHDLKPDEAILSADIAKILGVKVNDYVEIDKRMVRVSSIDRVAKGVDNQSATIGYAKLYVDAIPKDNYFLKTYLIQTEQSEELKAELHQLEPGHTYSTIHDQQAKIQSQLNTNAATLSILNTLSYVMTILSVLSSIFMMISLRQKDLAIIRMLSIRSRSLKGALRAELSIILLPSVFIGSVISVPLATQLLAMHHMDYGPLESKTLWMVSKGLMLFLVIYYLFLRIATLALEAISPLSVIRNEALTWKKSIRKIAWLSFGFTAITFLLYSIYIGKGASLISSMVIMIFIGIFFVITLILIWFSSVLKYRSKLMLYSIKNLKANRYANVIIVVSLAMTIFFVLIGFTLSMTLKDTIAEGSEETLHYNYLVYSPDPSVVEKALNTTPDVEGYNKLYKQDGVMMNPNIPRRGISIGKIMEQDYQLSYQLVSGMDLFQGPEGEVLVSTQFARETGLKVGDGIHALVDGSMLDYRIKGIYLNDLIDQKTLLMPAQTQPKGYPIFTVYAKSSEFEKSIPDVNLVHISEFGDLISKRLSDFLSIFQWICFICVFSSLLFNLNIVYMNLIQESKEHVIIRALGVGKEFLYKHLGVKMVISLIFSLLISWGLYYSLARIGMKMVFHLNVQIAASTVGWSIFCGFILVCGIYLLPFKVVQQSHGFEELREQV